MKKTRINSGLFLFIKKYKYIGKNGKFINNVKI